MRKFGTKPVKESKHQASKKNYKHVNWKPSKGELNHQKFLALKNVLSSPSVDE